MNLFFLWFWLEWNQRTGITTIPNKNITVICLSRTKHWPISFYASEPKPWGGGRRIGIWMERKWKRKIENVPDLKCGTVLWLYVRSEGRILPGYDLKGVQCGFDGFLPGDPEIPMDWIPSLKDMAHYCMWGIQWWWDRWWVYGVSLFFLLGRLGSWPDLNWLEKERRWRGEEVRKASFSERGECQVML